MGPMLSPSLLSCAASLISKPRVSPRPIPLLKRSHILAVDDSKGVRLAAQRALAAFACDVIEATNGFNALFAMERALPDLILLDVNMPIMDGLETLELLKSKPQLRVIPVIILASPADHGVMDRLTALGVNGIVMKPFTPAGLVEKIRSVIKLAPLPAAPTS